MKMTTLGLFLLTSGSLVLGPDAVQAQKGALAPAPKTGSKAAPERRTYKNPLLPDVEMADPHVIRHGKLYYLYATTDTRGYDAYVSSNLLDWENKGRVFKDPRGGLWAPDVFFDKSRAGKFYLYYTADIPNQPRGGLNKQIGVASSDSPLGPFVDQGVLVEKAIDAHLFQDDNKLMFLFYVDLTDGFKIMCQPMADPVTKTGDPQVVIRPTDAWEKAAGEVTEGPFVLKRKKTYYLMYSGSGANSPDYAIGYATSQSPMGPFEKFEGNPIASRGGKVLGPGHHCVVEGPDDQLWMLYHQKRNAGTNFERFLALDPIAFDNQGVLHVSPTRDTLEPAPRGKSRVSGPKAQ